MRQILSSLMVVSPAWLFTIGSALAQDCTWTQPDPNDRIGASRSQTAGKALEGIGLVRHGRVFRLAHDYDEATIPLPFGRSFDVTEFAADVSPPDPSQRFFDGFLEGNIGQVGTQFDGLGHAGHDFGFYNCATLAEVGPDASGRLTTLDVASVVPFFTRGVLLDFVNHSSVPQVLVNGKPVVEDSYLITREDVDEVLERQGVEAPGDGDVVLFRTGWDHIYAVDNDRMFFAPGPGIEVARWLAAQGVAMVGADTQAVEATAGGFSVELLTDPFALGAELGPIFNAVHFVLLTQNGVHLLENMRLGALADELLGAFHAERDPHGRGYRFGAGSPYEFLFVFAPLPVTGLEGSPGQPLAVR